MFIINDQTELTAVGPTSKKFQKKRLDCKANNSKLITPYLTFDVSGAS